MKEQKEKIINENNNIINHKFDKEKEILQKLIKKILEPNILKLEKRSIEHLSILDITKESSKMLISKLHKFQKEINEKPIKTRQRGRQNNLYQNSYFKTETTFYNSKRKTIYYTSDNYKKLNHVFPRNNTSVNIRNRNKSLGSIRNYHINEYNDDSLYRNRRSKTFHRTKNNTNKHLNISSNLNNSNINESNQSEHNSNTTLPGVNTYHKISNNNSINKTRNKNINNKNINKTINNYNKKNIINKNKIKINENNYTNILIKKKEK